MKKIFCLFAIALMACTSVFADDKPKCIDKDVNVGVFEKVVLKGSDKIIYTQGDKASVKIHGLKEQVDAVIINQDGKTLEVSRKSSVNNGLGWKSLFRAFSNTRKDEELVIYVTSPDLTCVKLTGSGDFIVKGQVDTDNLDIYLTGSGDIDFDDIICDNMIVSLVGSGDIEIDKVECVTSKIKLQGSGDVKVKQHNVRKTILDLYGSGDIDLHCSRCDEINANLSGSGDITISGEYKNVNRNKRGSGDINVR